MINIQETIKDPLNDNIGKLLITLDKYPVFTKEKRFIVTQILDLISKKKHIFFSAQKNTYLMGSVGDSYLYKVPANKKGHLKVFRGKTIRIVCVSSGSYWIRGYAAHLIP